MNSRISRLTPWCAAAVACLSLSSFASAVVENGVLVIDVQTGSENVGDQSGSFSKIRKIGGGTAVLTGESFKSFQADITNETGC